MPLPIYKVRVLSPGLLAHNRAYYIPDVISDDPDVLRNQPLVRQFVDNIKCHKALELESDGDIVIIPASMVAGNSWRLHAEAV